METVLVLPVLMVLLGGVMWLGQLQLNRARLLAADRFTSWNLANRHQQPVPNAHRANHFRTHLQTPPGDRHIFISDVISGERVHNSGTDFQHRPRGFWHGVADRVSLDVEVPGIVSAMMSAVDIHRQAPVGGEMRVEGMSSSRRHFVLARQANSRYAAAGGTRFVVPDVDSALGLNWEAVRDEPWFN